MSTEQKCVLLSLFVLQQRVAIICQRFVLMTTTKILLLAIVVRSIIRVKSPFFQILHF